MPLAWALGAATVIWIVILAAAAWGASTGATLLPAPIYRIASFICHQELHRSLFVGGAPWPVCARCLGLYVAAPLGALAAAYSRVALVPSRNLLLLCAAGAPTAATWIAEHAAAVPTSNTTRFAAALPLGAALAYVLVRTAVDTRSRRVSQYTLGDARRRSTQ
jgi:uncharacterized membrane protein